MQYSKVYIWKEQILAEYELQKEINEGHRKTCKTKSFETIFFSQNDFSRFNQTCERHMLAVSN